jgi:hypothetical protein
MELFITEIHNEPETIKPEVPYDVHGEERVIGFCELCFCQDEIRFLTSWHPTKNHHTLAHIGCVERNEKSCADWDYCTCQ